MSLGPRTLWLEPLGRLHYDRHEQTLKDKKYFQGQREGKNNSQAEGSIVAKVGRLKRVMLSGGIVSDSQLARIKGSG